MFLYGAWGWHRHLYFEELNLRNIALNQSPHTNSAAPAAAQTCLGTITQVRKALQCALLEEEHFLLGRLSLERQGAHVPMNVCTCFGPAGRHTAPWTWACRSQESGHSGLLSIASAGISLFVKPIQEGAACLMGPQRPHRRGWERQPCD